MRSSFYIQIGLYIACILFIFSFLYAQNTIPQIKHVTKNYSILNHFTFINPQKLSCIN